MRRDYQILQKSPPLKLLAGSTPVSMSLPMTNLSKHRFDYVASTALYSEASSQQRSYFSVREQVAQASRTSAAATSAVFARRGQSFCQHLFNVSEFQRHHTEDWKHFFPQFPSSTPDCYQPTRSFILTPSDTPHLFFNHTLILSRSVQFVWSFPTSDPSLRLWTN